MAVGTLLLAVGGVGTEGVAQEAQTATRPAAKARASIIDTKGREIGTATLTQQPNGVLIEVQVSGLPPGRHGFHVHEKGVCDAPTFEGAGSHFNPNSQKHGLEATGGPHPGDLPNLRIQTDGSARLSPLNPYVTLGEGINSLLKPGGTALIIHSGTDDYYSQPTGEAGERIACGKIEGSS
jgi:Cu-Zn family superoxide dismutase